jgi:putative ABC transport system permease protein
VYILKLIERNLRRAILRTILTGLTVAFSTFIFIVLMSVPPSIDRIVNDASATLRLIVLNKSLPLYGIPARYCDDIRAMPGAVACVAIAGFPATYRSPTDSILAVAEGLEIADVFPDYDLSGAARRAFTRERRGAFAGRVLMAKYHWKAGDLITLRGTGRDHLKLDFVILGEMPSHRYPNIFAFRRDYLEQARRDEGRPDADLAWNILVRVDKAADVAPLIHRIDSTFRDSDYEARALTESAALAGGLAAVGDVRGIIVSLCAIVMLTVSLIAANSTALMVRERLSDIAVMRAMGFSRAAVAAMLMGECAVIALAGGIAGALGAMAIFGGGISLTSLGVAGAVWIGPGVTAGAVLVAVAACVISAIIPVFNATRIPPAIAIGMVA